MFEGLNVALNASDTITQSLRNIGEEAADVSHEFAQTAGSSLGLAQGMNVTEEEIEDVQQALQHVPPSAEITAEALGHTQNVAEQLGDESQQLSANIGLVEETFSNLPPRILESSVAMGRFENAVEHAATDTYSLATGTHILSEGLDEATHGAAKMTASSHLLEQQLEDLRNDALGAAAGVETLDLATDKFDFGGLGINIGPLTGGIQQVAMAVAAMLPLILSLGAVLIGAAGAAVLLGGAVAALFAGGLVGRAEDMASATEDIEGTMEALGEIMSQVGEAVRMATAPLQALEMQEFALGGLRGFVRWLRMASEALASMSDFLIPMAERIGGAFLNETPEFFTAMEDMLVTVGPMIEDILIGLIRDVPKFIRFLTEETETLLPALSSFIDSLVGLLVPITQIGTTILSILLPPLSMLLDFINYLIRPLVLILTPALEFLGSILNWLAETFGPVIKLAAFLIGTITALGIVAFVLTNGLTLLATAFSLVTTVGAAAAAFLSTGLTGALYSVAVAAWSALGPVGILIGLLAGIAGYMGAFDGLMQMMPGFGDDTVSVKHSTEDEDAPPTRGGRGDIVRDESTNVDIGSIDASGGDTTEARLRRIVRQEVKNANSDQRQRETGQ